MDFKKLSSYLAAILIILLISISPSLAQALELINVTPLFQLTEGGGLPFHLPSDVAVAPDGRIYVLDGVNGRVVVFDKNGKFLFDFGKRGTALGELWDAFGLEVHAGNGNIYIADSKNHRIQIFSAEGKYLFFIDLPTTGVGKQPADPYDLVIKLPNEDVDIFTIPDKRIKCYITDNNNHVLHIYEDNGTFIQTWGFMGFEKEQLRFPTAVAVDNKNNIYICETGNTRVQVLNEDFEFTHFVSTWGVRKGQVFRPQGMALDPLNNVYISDSYINVVQAFNEDRDFLGAIAVNDKLQKYDSPSSLLVKDKRLYIVEMWGNKVSVFKLADYPKK